eukprot:scaffold67181_cov33-Phaeocystis_antarctica.AAC.3
MEGHRQHGGAHAARGLGVPEEEQPLVIKQRVEDRHQSTLEPLEQLGDRRLSKLLRVRARVRARVQTRARARLRTRARARARARLALTLPSRRAPAAGAAARCPVLASAGAPAAVARSRAAAPTRAAPVVHHKVRAVRGARYVRHARGWHAYGARTVVPSGGKLLCASGMQGAVRAPRTYGTAAALYGAPCQYRCSALSAPTRSDN